MRELAEAFIRGIRQGVRSFLAPFFRVGRLLKRRRGTCQ